MYCCCYCLCYRNGLSFVVAVFVVCAGVGLSALEVLEVSVGTDMGCFCLRLCISQSFFALAGKASMSCMLNWLPLYIAYLYDLILVWINWLL